MASTTVDMVWLLQMDDIGWLAERIIWRANYSVPRLLDWRIVSDANSDQMALTTRSGKRVFNRAERIAFPAGLIDSHPDAASLLLVAARFRRDALRRHWESELTEMKPTLTSLAGDLAAGRVTSRMLVEDCLARIQIAPDDVKTAFVRVDARTARDAADGMDRLRAAGAAPSRFAGIPISIKDLFDIAGQTTAAGSRALSDAPPASQDALAVARLRRAGFVVVGRTNMTEFAYSGLGVNPHYGTPPAPWDRASKRVPGGSSSGAAISVAEGMAHAALGTDTGGSCRVPAAFTGLVGYKPTASRVPLDGVVPLAQSLDSIGPLARSAACCAIIDAILAGEEERPLDAIDISGLRLAVPITVALDDLDPVVAAAFDNALSALSRRGARIERIAFPEFAEIGPMNARGGFAASESYAWHRDLLARRGDDYDPRVRVRIARGAEQSAADYIDLIARRRSLIARAEARMEGFDALVLPTVAILPPRLADLASDDAYMKANMLSLRNTSLINTIDGCAISLPIAAADDAPVGFMLAGAHGRDARIFAIAAAAEACFALQS